MAEGISKSQAVELADAWEVMAATAEPTARRETLRECADAVRMLATMQAPTPLDCPHAAPFRYCAECPVSPCPIGLGTTPNG